MIHSTCEGRLRRIYGIENDLFLGFDRGRKGMIQIVI